MVMEICISSVHFQPNSPRVGSGAVYNKPTSFPGRVLWEATEPG